MYYAVLVLATACFAMGIVAAKPVLPLLGVRGFLRVRLVAGVIGALALWRGAPLELEFAGVPWVIASLLVVPLGLNVTFFAALRHEAVGPTNALRLTQPLWVAALSFVLFGVAPVAPEWASIGLISVGIWLLATSGPRASSSAPIVLGLSAGALQGGGLLLQRHALELIGREELLLYQNAVFLVAMQLACWLGPPSRPKAQGPVPRWACALAVLSGALTYVVGEYLKFTALPECSSYVAVALLQLSLPFSVVFARVVLGERISRRQLAAVASVFAGAVLGSLGGLWR
jgi:drug/metabolite transporter (DMT)-like permease